MQLHKRTKRALLLLSATLLYLTFGALVFGYFEYEYDLQLREEIREARLAMHRKYNFDGKDFALLEQVVVKSIPFAAGLQWKFLGAVYFAVTVVTTVGYGHSAPSTAPGKLFCMVFALIGIPLGLVTFQSVGERINHIIRSCLMRIGQSLSKRGSSILQNVKSRHLLFVSSTIGVLTITIGTIVFHKLEHWSLFDSYYYCVITLSTIGFGDFVPLQTRGRLQNDVGYWAFTVVFILFGLAIFSACVNLLILEFMARNADMITAGTRLRKGILSLKRSASFKALSFRDSAFTTPRRMPKKLKRSNSVDTKPLNGKHETCLPCKMFCTMQNGKDHSQDHSCQNKKKHKRERVYFAPYRVVLSPINSRNNKSFLNSNFLGLSFSGCGFLGSYHFGVMLCFQKHGKNLLSRITHFSGSSAGSLIAALIVLSPGYLQEGLNEMYDLAGELERLRFGAVTPGFNLANRLTGIVDRFIPENVSAANGRLFISLTKQTDRTNHIVSIYTDRRHLLDCLTASCYIPYYSKGLTTHANPPEIDGCYYIDGGFSNNLPIIEDIPTITVSPFSGSAMISPKDAKVIFEWKVVIGNQVVNVNKQNIVRAAQSLFPPNRQLLNEYYEIGFRDAMTFLQDYELFERPDGDPV
ncbi:ion channel domain-containing protein [Ditylenchus destructor]|nr:ion channel domain-containing protein [Ditylenchus destructor]